jgi:hypothetical protein
MNKTLGWSPAWQKKKKSVLPRSPHMLQGSHAMDRSYIDALLIVPAFGSPSIFMNRPQITLPPDSNHPLQSSQLRAQTSWNRDKSFLWSSHSLHALLNPWFTEYRCIIQLLRFGATCYVAIVTRTQGRKWLDSEKVSLAFLLGGKWQENLLSWVHCWLHSPASASF